MLSSCKYKEKGLSFIIWLQISTNVLQSRLTSGNWLSWEYHVMKLLQTYVMCRIQTRGVTGKFGAIKPECLCSPKWHQPRVCLWDGPRGFVAGGLNRLHLKLKRVDLMVWEVGEKAIKKKKHLLMGHEILLSASDAEPQEPSRRTEHSSQEKGPHQGKNSTHWCLSTFKSVVYSQS